MSEDTAYCFTAEEKATAEQFMSGFDLEIKIRTVDQAFVIRMVKNMLRSIGFYGVFQDDEHIREALVYLGEGQWSIEISRIVDD